MVHISHEENNIHKLHPVTLTFDVSHWQLQHLRMQLASVTTDPSHIAPDVFKNHIRKILARYALRGDSQY